MGYLGLAAFGEELVAGLNRRSFDYGFAFAQDAKLFG